MEGYALQEQATPFECKECDARGRWLGFNHVHAKVNEPVRSLLMDLDNTDGNRMQMSGRPDALDIRTDDHAKRQAQPVQPLRVHQWDDKTMVRKVAVSSAS